jgi:endo-1,4-beta-xylanase
MMAAPHVSPLAPALIAVLTAALLSLAPSPTAATPIATGQAKFLGSAYGPNQTQDFIEYWNKVTPENAGKWGEVEAVRDRMEWGPLDEAYGFAKRHGLLYHHHVLIWGNQQPEWMEKLPAAEQREEIEEWFAAVAARYPEIDWVEVVNEPLHDPPSKDDDGGGNYLQALGGSGESGWDWILEAYRMARRHFPDAKLLINEYSITNQPADARRYLQIIELLQKEHLVDAIGVQGHAFSTTTERSADEHRAVLDDLAATGLPIHVTEMDIDGPTDATQLADYQRMFPVFWDHPGVAGVTLWGYRPGLWRDSQRAYLIDRRGRERPALMWLRGYVRGVHGPVQ